jgi:predicted NUDIX family NTP pyrophosphohydrolase
MARSDEISAGLLAYRRRGQWEFLLAHPGGPYWARKDDGAWTIPKGLVRPDDLLAGAQREFREETGFVAEGPFAALKPVRQRSGKTVHAFAFAGDFDAAAFSSNTFEMEWPPRSGKQQSFPEVDRLGWFAYEAALNKIIAYQRPFLLELQERLAEAD